MGISLIQKKMRSRFKFFFKKLKPRTETVSYLLYNYLEICHLSPVKAMQVMMKKLRGRFAMMALIADGKWLMAGCRDYPLAIGRNNETVYFCTEPSALTQFSPLISSVGEEVKPKIFCMTLSQSEILTPEPF
jgi:glucosamine 6-phosphate synthetase-like amidotransferase/phosphosugar isomerase protein